MLRRITRLCLLVALPLGCQPPPPAAAPTTPPNTAASPEPTPTSEPPDAALPEAEQILARSIDAVGGRAAIEAIRSSYMEAKTEIKAQNIEMITRIWSKGDNFYVESDLPGMGLTQVWKKGDDIWSKDPINGFRKLEGDEAAQARWTSDPMLAANWDRYFDDAQTLRRSKAGDTDIVEVQLTREGNDKDLVLLFEADTALPVGMAFEQQTPMGAMPLRITQQDFREVAGVKVPYQTVTDLQLMSMVQTTQKFEVNVEVDDAKFDPPTDASKK